MRASYLLGEKVTNRYYPQKTYRQQETLPRQSKTIEMRAVSQINHQKAGQPNQSGKQCPIIESGWSTTQKIRKIVTHIPERRSCSVNTRICREIPCTGNEMLVYHYRNYADDGCANRERYRQ